MNRIAPLALLAAVACAPQSAKLSDASLVGWLSEDTSFTLYQDLVDFADADWDETWDIDCRLLEEADEGLRIQGGLDICGTGNDFGVVTESYLEGESWLNFSAWRGFSLALDNAWRGEGLFTHEGDLHVGFHHRLPGGEDFRFMFVLDPDFEPTECIDDGNGGTTAQPIDGRPIRDAWNETWQNLDNVDLTPFMQQARSEFPNGQLYFLNARSYQIDAANIGDPNRRRWTLLEDWVGGFARGTFASVEDMHSRPNYYGRPFAYQAVDADNFAAFGNAASLVWYLPETGLFGDAENHVEYARQDLNRAAPMAVGYQPIHIDNTWRGFDEDKAGFEGWDELGYSWVVLSEDSLVEPGGTVRGAFSILMDPDDSASRWIVQGRFEIPRVRKERWGGQDLRAELAEEEGFDPCISGSPTDYTTERY